MPGWTDDDFFTRPQTRDRGEIDFTNLIDVVLLLLIFLIYSTALNSRTQVDTPSARHFMGVDPDRSTIVTILAEDVAREPARFVLGNGFGNKGSIDEVATYIAAGMKAGRKDVMVKAERLVPHRFVNEVAQLVARQGEVSRFVIAVQGERE
ncbi:biopolymer transporter ExbD [bacterium]|jgi:biopolymer transport protein TolR|nr:biopolymer transporter ExbD [bacterium]